MKRQNRLDRRRSRNRRILAWAILVFVGAAATFTAYRYSTNTSKVDIPVAKVRVGEFVRSVRTRGEVRSVRADVLTAPQVPNPRIIRLARSGEAVKAGEIICEFDAAQQEQTFLVRDSNVRTAESEIVQLSAIHKIADEMDGMSLMRSQYNLELAKMEVSKSEIISEIEGAKDRIDVTISEGNLGHVNATITAHGQANEAGMQRAQQKKGKAMRDADRVSGHLSKMVLRAPHDGIVNILPNFRSAGSFGSTPPPFKEGDQAWQANAKLPALNSF